MMEEIKITSGKDHNCAWVHAWKGDDVVMTGVVMRYSSGKVSCFGDAGKFDVSSLDEGISKTREIIAGKFDNLRAEEAMSRITEQINNNVNAAAHQMTLRIAKFRGKLFEDRIRIRDEHRKVMQAINLKAVRSAGFHTREIGEFRLSNVTPNELTFTLNR